MRSNSAGSNSALENYGPERILDRTIFSKGREYERQLRGIKFKKAVIQSCSLLATTR